MKLTISIVNYNTGDYLVKCLQSIQSIENEAEIATYVVDNASSDDSIKKAQKLFPKVNFILNKVNLGFGKAHNQVLKKLNTEYALILNPDTLLGRAVISTMLKFMDENSDVGAATCKIVLPDGSIDLTAHRGFPTPLASLLYFLGIDWLYHLSLKNLNNIHEVDAISGSFFLTRKSILDNVGFFDEDFFMYAEDIDLCFRIKESGYKIMYVPDVKILHFKGVSSGLKKHSQEITTASSETKKRSLDAFYETMKSFYQKHYQKKYPAFINLLVYLGINLKWWLAKRRLGL